MPKRKTEEPKPTAPGGAEGPATPALPGRGQIARPLAHADSPTLAADSAEFASWRCQTDGQQNTGKRCTTCGTVKA